MEYPVKISVIVAVYNAENYLYRCVDCLLAQTFKDFEILLVDDGSSDKSGKLCDEYARRDSRILVFHKENGGVASARQCGLDHSRGKYTIHVDPDDWVEPEMLEHLYRHAIVYDSDMVVCDYFEEVNGDKKYVPQYFDHSTNESLLDNMLLDNLQGMLWNKLIKRECYKQYKIAFPDTIIWEDLFVVCKLLLSPIKVSYLNEAFYHYDRSINESSITSKNSMRKLESQVYFIDYFQSIIGPYHHVQGLNYRKCVTKDMAWVLNISEIQFQNLYPEVNEIFTSGNYDAFTLRFYIKQFLLGHTKASKLAYKFMFSFYFPILRRVKKYLKI